MYSVVDQLVLRPPPFAYADRLVDAMDPKGNILTPRKVAGWQAQPALFERFEAYAPAQFDVTGGAEPERINGLLVSVGLFPMLGVEPRLGRGFMAGDGRPGSEPVAIIGENIWRRRFGADTDALGARILLNDIRYTIVGVMPRGVHLLGDDETVWLPVDVAARITDSSLDSFYGLARLARGVRLADAQQTADRLAGRMQAAAPLAQSWHLRIHKKKVAWVNPTTATALYVLLGAVSFVLFITCANVASLFLSLAPLRLREMAIRAALGSGRARLIRSVLIESVAIAAAGGALGLMLARWGLQAVLAAAPARLAFMSTSTVDVDGRVVAVAMALTLITGVVVGLLPAIRGSRGNLESTLRASAPAARGSYGRAPALLVILEVAFSMLLLLGAALMARTLVNLERIDPGFRPDGLVAVHVDLPTDRYPSSEARGVFFDAVVERLKAVPGVIDAALAGGVPPGQGGFTSGALEGEGSPSPPAQTMVPTDAVSGSYFRTLGIPLLAGRTFETTEADGDVIVSKGLADRLWPGENAVGRRFRTNTTSPWRTIVGVVGNVEARAAREDRTDLQLYSPRIRKPAAVAATAAPRSYAWTLLVVRAADPLAALPAIKREIWAVDPAQPVDRAALVSDLYAEGYARQRFVLLVMGGFSVIALALTAAGIFGVLSQIVARRTREIGIRVALGARPQHVRRLVLGRGVAFILIGSVAGLAAAVGVTRVLRALLFGVSPTDPATFALVTVLLGAVGLLACWLPTRAAMRIAPASALRVD